MTDQLIPKASRRMKQPRKDVLREQLALATADSVAEIQAIRPMSQRNANNWRHAIAEARKAA